MSIYRQINDLPGEQIADVLGLNLDHGRGVCPSGHESKSGKSFKYNRKYNNWHCFHCGKNWSNIDLWSTIRRVQVKDALVEICNQFGIDPPKINSNPFVFEEIPSHVERRIKISGLQDLVQFYNDQRRSENKVYQDFCDALIKLGEYFEKFSSQEILKSFYEVCDRFFILMDEHKLISDFWVDNQIGGLRQKIAKELNGIKISEH